MRHFLLVLVSILALITPIVTDAQAVPDSLYQEMEWRMIGPFRGGRTRGVAGVSGDPATLYIGVCDGGVWRSTDYGRTWTPIFDDQPTQSIGAIAVAPSHPKTVYVASGEGLQRPDLSVGNGIYRSDDGGDTWTHRGLREGQQIPSLAVDPRNPNRVFAAVLGHPYGPNEQRGIFRSTDGGKSWDKVLYIDENTGGNDVDIDPSNPDVVYASFWQGRQGPWEYGNAYGGEKGGIFKSTDGGTTWHQLAGGLPDQIVEANLSIAPSNPNRLYVVLATALRSGYMSGEGQALYRSDDGGVSWTKTTDDPRPLMRIGGGDLPMLGVDPTNPDVVYSTSIVTVRSTDAGKSWVSLRGAPGGDDYQNIWIDPKAPNTILLAADQGAVVSVNGGQSWSSWYNQPTAQLYHVQATNEFPYKVCSGQQESGSVCISTRGDDGAITFRDWHPVGAIEYGYVTPDPLNPDVVYGAGRNVVSKHHWSTGQTQDVTPIPLLGDDNRVDRTQPLFFSPADPHILYYAANRVFRTDDGGQTWQIISPDLAREHPGVPESVAQLAAKDENNATRRGVVYALGPSFKTPDTLWAGTDDGLIHLTRDGGRSWANVTPEGVTPWSKVTQIEASHFDDQSAYASVSRFRVDDLRPYIYRTHDGGKSWQKITAGLPDDAPVNAVREDPVRQGLLFAATETGVWVSFDDGDRWQSLELNLPHSSMRDLWIHQNDLIVATHGRSFWVLDDLSPLRQVGSATVGDTSLLKPSPAIRVRRDLNTDTPLPADEPMGQNPPAGAIIDYVLGKPAGGPVTLEILDGTGTVIRRYASSDQPPLSDKDLAEQMIPTYWVRPFRALPTGAGMHRWVWDLRYERPEHVALSYPISAIPHDTPRVPQGPLALPGQYTVRLTANGQAYTAPLTVVMDPRVKTSEAGLRQRFDIERNLAALMSESGAAIDTAHSIREQITELTPKAKGSLAKELSAFDLELKTVLEGAKAEKANAPTPGMESLAGSVESLYDAVGQTDAAPTLAQVEAVRNTETSLRQALEQWTSLQQKTLTRLNGILHTRGLSEINPQRKPRHSMAARNEE